MAQPPHIMEGVGSDGKRHTVYEFDRPIDLENETPLETYINSGEMKKRWCCCVQSVPTVLWTLFVIIVFANMYVTSNHIYVDDQIALGDEKDIAHLFRQVKDLQDNQRILMEAMLRLAEQHDPDRQEKIAALVRDGISRTNCALNKADVLCDTFITEDLLGKLDATSAKIKIHQQSQKADSVQNV